jgi:hypothetical protein
MPTICLPAAIAVCRSCGESDLMAGMVTAFRVVASGNRGRLECAKHGEVAWDVQAGRPFENIALEQIKQIQALAEQLEASMRPRGSDVTS